MYLYRSTRNLHYGFKMVPQQTAIIVERLGKFHKVLSPGLNFLIPFLDYAEYTHSLKEEVYPISDQMSITKDSVTLHLDGVLYLKVIDPKKASYGVNDPIFAMIQMAQTTMRSELGKYTLDQTFEERENLNAAIVKIINDAAKDWGIECIRYEIRDITPPSNIKKAMELEGEAERQKRADILNSEKQRAAEINIAEGKRQASILRAEGEAEAIIIKSKSIAEGIKSVSNAISSEGGLNAVNLKLTEGYIEQFAKLAETNNTVIIPNENASIASIISQFLTVSNSFYPKPEPTPVQVEKIQNEPVRRTKKPEKFSDPILESSD